MRLLIIFPLYTIRYNIDLDIDPNEDIDNVIAHEIEELYIGYEEDEDYFKLEVFPEFFKENQFQFFYY